MARHFGVRARDEFDRFWNEPGNDNDRDVRWPFYVLAAVVLMIAAFGIFIA